MIPSSVNGRAGRHYLLIHGTATTARIWAGVQSALGQEARAVAPDRPSTGRLDSEIDALRPFAGRSVVLGGVSGGATLGLGLLAAGVPLAAAVLHEPAVGSLQPGLLSTVAAAWADGGLEAFGRALYGPVWQPSDGPADASAVERDLAMFLDFEPAAPRAAARGSGPPTVLVTVGESSPPVRHRAAAALNEAYGLPVEVIPGCGHAAHLERPEYFAGLLRSVAR